MNSSSNPQDHTEDLKSIFNPDSLFCSSAEPDPTTDHPALDLSSIPESQWMEKAFGLAVKPTQAIEAYFRDLKNPTWEEMDSAAEALEKHYGVRPPWFICAQPQTDPKSKTTTLAYFYLGNETI